MVSIDVHMKFWVTVSLASSLIWATYFLIPSYDHFFRFVQGLPEPYVARTGIVYWASHVGQTALFVGAALGLLSVILVWGLSRSFMRVKRLVAAAILLEAIYYLGFIPSVWWLQSPGTVFQSVGLSYAYLLQIIFAAPFLTILSVKIWNYKERAQGPSVYKWGGVTFVGFVAALWANAVFRWFDMLSTKGLVFLLTGVRAVGFLNAVVFMSLAVVFAVAGVFRLMKRNESSAIKWLGLSLTMIGLQYTIYLIYAYYVNFVKSALLIDVWTAPLLGLGICVLAHRD